MLKNLYIILFLLIIGPTSLLGMYRDMNLTDEEQQYLNVLKSTVEKVNLNERVKGYGCFSKLKFSSNLLNDLKNIVKQAGPEGLLKQGRSPLSALHAAIYKKDIKSVNYILSFDEVKGHLLNLPIISLFKDAVLNTTPLVLAIKVGSMKIAKILVENEPTICFSYLEKQFEEFLENNMNLKKQDRKTIRKSFEKFKSWYKEYSNKKAKDLTNKKNII